MTCEAKTPEDLEKLRKYAGYIKLALGKIPFVNVPTKMGTEPYYVYFPPSRISGSVPYFPLAANVENMRLMGSASISGTGNELDNIITGNAANDEKWRIAVSLARKNVILQDLILPLGLCFSGRSDEEMDV